MRKNVTQVSQCHRVSVCVLTDSKQAAIAIEDDHNPVQGRLLCDVTTRCRCHLVVARVVGLLLVT